MTRRFLPESGQVSLGELVTVLSSAAHVLKCTEDMEVRTLLGPAQNGDHFVHLATVARVLPAPGNPAEYETTVGSFRALALAANTGAHSDVATLMQVLLWWKTKIPDAEEGHYANAWSRWYSSKNAWGAEPCWEVQMSPKESIQWDKTEASGPFRHVPTGWFGEDFTALAMNWLGGKVFDINTSTPLVLLVIPDCRARFDELALSASELTGRVTGRELSGLVCTLSGEDYDGQEHKATVPVDTDRVSFSLPRTLRSLRLGLWSSRNVLLDQYEETEHRLSWPQSVLRANQPARPAPSLDTALDEGESDRVEFKASVPAHRSDNKCQEFLESVVAFANANGGKIFIGVDDRAVVVGFQAELMRLGKRERVSDSKERRDLYLHVLGKFIAEGVVPSIKPAFVWHAPAGLPVLEVQIPRGAEPPYHLYENNRFFLRRGATDRAMSRSDLELAFRKMHRTDD